jgi:hypothetical protein
MNDLRLLIREMMKELIQDDALFKKAEYPGILDKLDTHKDTSVHHSRSYMAKPQLYSLVKNAEEILSMLEDNEDIADWMESHIAQSEQMINAVYDKLSFKKRDN